MSDYNSGNTKILATCEKAGGNTRMLLLHEFMDGTLEYIIGSYFLQEPRGHMSFTECPSCKNSIPSVENLTDYSWDWGHYFFDVVAAVDYWKEEVLGETS